MLTRIIPLMIPFGVRLFHASPVSFDDFNSAATREENFPNNFSVENPNLRITGFKVPDSAGFDVKTNASLFTIPETQSFLNENFHLYKDQWKTVVFPPISSHKEQSAPKEHQDFKHPKS